MNFNKYHVSKNLLDLTALINAPSGTFTTQDGTETFTADHLLEIQLKPNTYYKMSSNYVKTGTKLNIIYLQYADVLKATTSTISPSYKTNDTGVVKIAMYTSRDGADDFISGLAWVMLNEGATALPYEPYSSDVWHDIPHYIHNTSTDTITTLPADVYADGTNATVGLKGNMSQTGTPTPSSPITPSECGEMTGNLYNINAKDVNNGYVDNAQLNQDGTTEEWGSAEISEYIPISGNTAYTFNGIGSYNTPCYGLYDENKQLIGAYKYSGRSTINFTSSNNARYFRFTHIKIATQAMMVEGAYTTSTMPDYEPYGQYKIPISSASTTTPVYLGEVESTRRIKKFVLTGEENWAEYSGFSAQNCYQFNTNITNHDVNSEAISTHFTYTDVLRTLIDNDGTFMFDSNKYIRVHISSCTTPEDFKAYLAAQYANGTPVTVWYVLANETTGIVNEPIRKIGEYADTVSGITIPTTAGADTLSIGTTLQPSEVTVNYKGWHPVADVHEYDSNYTIATMQALTIAQLQSHTIGDLEGGEWV